MLTLFTPKYFAKIAQVTEKLHSEKCNCNCNWLHFQSNLNKSACWKIVTAIYTEKEKIKMYSTM